MNIIAAFKFFVRPLAAVPLIVALAFAPMANAVDCPPFTSVENCVNLAIAEEKEEESRDALIVVVGGILLAGVFFAVSTSTSDAESEGEEPDPVDKAAFAPLAFGNRISGFFPAMSQNSKVNLRFGYRAESDGDDAFGTLNTAIEWRF